MDTWVRKMEKLKRKVEATSSAKILSYKVHHSKKKLLIVGNGSPAHCFAVQIGKVFRKEDARQITALVSSGRF